MEAFEGSLDGHEGTFNFAHSATTQGNGRGGDYLVIVPSSGTSALVGIQGTGGLDADGTASASTMSSTESGPDRDGRSRRRQT
jgi:hypothetical protein